MLCAFSSFTSSILSHYSFLLLNSPLTPLFLLYSIMVLDAGHLIEYDTPVDLLADRSSLFYSMARDAGLA
jgi:hypothetical protein